MENSRYRNYLPNFQIILLVAVGITTLTIIMIIVTWVLTKLNMSFSLSVFRVDVALIILTTIGASVIIINHFYAKTSTSSKTSLLTSQEEISLPSSREQAFASIYKEIEGSRAFLAISGLGGAGKTSLLPEHLLAERLTVHSNLMVLQYEAFELKGSYSPSGGTEFWKPGASYQRKPSSAKRQYPLRKKKKMKKKKRRKRSNRT